MDENAPQEIREAITAYQHLVLGGKEVCTPYYINANRTKDLRAMIGKGAPEEIVIEARIWEKLKGVDFTAMSSIEIKKFLEGRNLGIDCSGFIIHVLDGLYKARLNKHVWNYLKIPQKGVIASLKYYLRPVEKLGAEVITNAENCITIDLQDVKTGDLIRSKAKKTNAHHIMIVTTVKRNQDGAVTALTYTHSSPYYGDRNGVKEGEILVSDQNKPLWEQTWLEKDEHGVNHTYEGFMVNVEDNGLRRLKTYPS